MTLVYHGTPTLYPEHAAGPSSAGQSNIAAIRFPHPVRLQSIRVIPEGVAHPTGVGQTTPSEFVADIMLNVAPSDPINALAKTSVRVTPAPHAIDYKIDMPEDTTTRLVVIRAPVQHITLSLYAFGEAEAGDAVADAMAMLSFQDTDLPLPPPDQLVAVLPRLHQLDEETRSRVLSTLVVASHRGPILGLILDNQAAAEALLLPGAEEATASVLGLEDASGAQDSLAALLNLDRPWSLRWPATSTTLSSALALARLQRDSLHPQAAACLSVVLERLDAIRNLDADDSKKRLTASLLSRTLPPLAVDALTRGSNPSITLSPESLPSLQGCLAGVTATGESLAPAARKLIRQLAPAPPTPPPSTTPALRIEGVPSIHTQSPLVRALEAPSSIQLSPSAAELLSAIAPSLYSSLGTAVVPPLGVPPTHNFASRGASDYAGKVYSAHEFRKERDTTSGLGVGASSAGRKASRHVDDFRRA